MPYAYGARVVVVGAPAAAMPASMLHATQRRPVADMWWDENGSSAAHREPHCHALCWVRRAKGVAGKSLVRPL